MTSDMADVHSPSVRSKNMRAIRSARTSTEDLLAKLIWRAGHRYRRNDKSVPGKPDICFKRQKVAVFCDGEFWHGKDWKTKRKKISQNRAYWIPKIERNMQRDRETNRLLRKQGWTVLRFWHEDIECDPQRCVDKVIEALTKSSDAASL